MPDTNNKVGLGKVFSIVSHTELSILNVGWAFDASNDLMGGVGGGELFVQVLHVPGHEIEDPGLGVVVQAGDFLGFKADSQVTGL